MSEVKEQKSNVRRGRGIASARGTIRLKFDHTMANKANGLFLGHLDNVEVKMIDIREESTGMPSFNGMSIPKLVLTFASNEEDANKRHYVTLQFPAVESNVNTIPGGKEAWKVDSVFDWLKHILNVYVLKGRDLTDEEAAGLSLNFEDFDENGDYVPVDPVNVVAGWKVLYERFAAMLNPTGDDAKPVYQNKDGKPITIWMKLIRYIKNNKKGWQAINNGELAFPTFVGEGCIEMFKQNAAPSIKVNVIRECIVPKNIEKPKAPNMPNLGAMGAMGGIADPMMGGTSMNIDPAFGGDITAQAGDDMPFGDYPA